MTLIGALKRDTETMSDALSINGLGPRGTSTGGTSTRATSTRATSQWYMFLWWHLKFPYFVAEIICSYGNAHNRSR